MIINAEFSLTAAADPVRRRIVGMIVPFGQEGHAHLGGQPATLVFSAGGLVWDDPNQIKLMAEHRGPGTPRPDAVPVFAGRCRDLVETDAGIMATFSVFKTTAGNDLLAEMAEGVRTGLSVEAVLPDDLEPNDQGVWQVMASNPAKLNRVAAVDQPAFASAQVSEIAASAPTTVAAAEVPDDQLAQIIDLLTKSLEGTTMPADQPADPAAASAAPDPLPRAVAATAVTREAFPYGHPGAEGVSMFKDIATAAKGDSLAAARVEKAHSMMAETQIAPIGTALTAAGEPVVRSTLLVPNVYDIAHYAAQLKFPRVIADRMPGVAISAPNPQIVPIFTSSFADGGSGEPVVASTEGTNPAQAELAVGSATVTPVGYTGLFDIARQALDAAGPATDVLCMNGLLESYAQVTEGAAVTAILANGTTGTDVTSNADTIDIEPRTALKSIRTQMGTFYAGRGMPADSILYASDVYQAALGADGTDGRPLYSFLSDRYQVMNSAAAADQPAAMSLNVYGVQGLLAFKLTATKFVIVKWADTIRYESPTLQFRFEQTVGPANVRLAVFGYFAARTLQAKGTRYFSQL